MSQAIWSPVPQIRTVLAPTGLVERLSATLAASFASLRREWELRSAARSLESLDARALADIGIGPGQAEAAARYGRRSLSRFPATERVEPRSVMPSSWTEWR